MDCYLSVRCVYKSNLKTGSAVITLYTISTAEKWNDIMVGVGENHRGCEEASDCGMSL